MTLKEFRLSKNKTQQEMADLIGVTKSMYEKYEYGKNYPSMKMLIKIKEIFPDFNVDIFLKTNHN